MKIFRFPTFFNSKKSRSIQTKITFKKIKTTVDTANDREKKNKLRYTHRRDRKYVTRILQSTKSDDVNTTN